LKVLSAYPLLLGNEGRLMDTITFPVMSSLRNSKTGYVVSKLAAEAKLKQNSFRFILNKVKVKRPGNY